MKLGELFVDVMPKFDSGSLVQEMRKAERQAETAGRGAGDSFGKGMSGSLKKLGGVIGGFLAVAGLKSAASDVISLSADAEQSVGGVQAVFKDYAKSIVANSKAADRALGLSANSYRELATTIGSQLKNAGIPMDQIAGRTDKLISQGADMAAMFGGTTAEAVEALSSALKGEMDPIERYGITLNDAALKAEALSLGLYSGKGPLDTFAKSMAAQSLVTKQGADSLGAYNRESDTAAGRASRAAAQWENLKTTLGDRLLPVWSGLMDFVGTTVIPKFDELVTTHGPKVEAFFTRAKDGAQGLYDLLANGEYNETLKSAFGWEEDHPMVTFLTDVREKSLEFSNFVQTEVVPRLTELRDFIRDELIPRIGDLGDWWRDDALPALTTVRDFLRDEFQPSWEELVRSYNENIKPAVDDLRIAFERNKPELMLLAGLVGKLLLGLLVMEIKIRSTILPVLLDLGGAFGGFLLTEIGKTLDKIGFVVTKTGEMKDAFVEFMEAVREFKLPGWITGVAGASAGVAAAIKGAATGILGAVGDAPGSYRGTQVGGGNALARVRSMLPAGLSISSTYRSPAQNRAVGGHPTSLHMDRANPAVDIAGPTRLLDQFAAQLSSVGGWRQLLWRVAGHYDHIHVAHAGGLVNSGWGTVPGLRQDERPVIAQVGERILSRNQNRAYENGSNQAMERLVAALERNQNRGPLIGQATIRETVDADTLMQRLEFLAGQGAR